jgi:hypothetical protein
MEVFIFLRFGHALYQLEAAIIKTLIKERQVGWFSKR